MPNCCNRSNQFNDFSASNQMCRCLSKNEQPNYIADKDKYWDSCNSENNDCKQGLCLDWPTINKIINDSVSSDSYKHGMWIYRNNYQMADYMGTANIWAGDFEYDWTACNDTIGVYTYYPKKRFTDIPITYGPDFYSRLLDKDLTIVFDGRIDGVKTNEFYEPCWGKKGDPYPKDWTTVMKTDDFTTKNDPTWLKKVGADMIYKKGVDAKSPVYNGSGILQFDVNDSLRYKKPPFGIITAAPRYIYREYIDRIKNIQMDLEPYNNDTRNNINYIIEGLVNALQETYDKLKTPDNKSLTIDMSQYDIKVQAFLFPKNIYPCTDNQLYDTRFLGKFVPVFSCYDLWDNVADGTFKMAQSYNVPDCPQNLKISYKYKLWRDIFDPIAKNWYNRPFRLGIPMAASVHEYEEVVPAKCDVKCREYEYKDGEHIKKVTLCDASCPDCNCPCLRKKTGYTLIDYLEVFFTEFDKFINDKNNCCIRKNFKGFDFWAATINNTYPNANNTPVNASIVQNQFLPMQPRAETTLFVKLQLAKLNMLPKNC